MLFTPQKSPTPSDRKSPESTGEDETALISAMTELSQIQKSAEAIRSKAEAETAASRARCERVERAIARSQLLVPGQR